MIKVITTFIAVFILLIPITGSTKDLKHELRTLLKNNPSIIIDIINENPALFVDALQKAQDKTKQRRSAKNEKKNKGRFNAALNKPFKPKISPNDAIRGTQNAPIVIVEYSDFQCRYCAKANKVVQNLLQKYEGKIQFIYKHAPSSLSDKAKLAAQYYEAIRMQSNKVAFKFYDNVFKNPQGLSGGEAYLIALAKIAGVDTVLLKQTLKNKIVLINEKIQEDINEGKKFGIQTTPAFLVNGIPVKDIYTVDYFDNIIQLLQKKNIIKI